MLFNLSLRRFFDKTRGRNIPLEDFPSLLAMQGHTGFFGGLLTASWFIAVYQKYYAQLWSNGGSRLVVFSVGIVAAFFGLQSLCLWLTGHYYQRLRESQQNPRIDNSNVEYYVRYWIGGLTAAYVIVCCILIWLTGGATSPFTSLYVMIFTLTISKCRIRHPGVWVFLLFFVGILCASLAPLIFEAPMATSDLVVIGQERFNAFWHGIFISAALFVPTYSQWSVERRAEKSIVVIASTDQRA